MDQVHISGASAPVSGRALPAPLGPGPATRSGPAPSCRFSKATDPTAKLEASATARRRLCGAPAEGNLKYAPGRAATRAWRWGEVRLPGTGTGTGTSHPRSLSRPYARPHENASPRPVRKRRQTQTAKRSVRRLIIRGLGLVGQLGMERTSPTRTRPSHYFGVSHANALAQFLWVAG